MSESNPFDTGNSAPAVSFATRDAHGNLTHAPIGTRYEFKVTEAPKEVQARDFESGSAAFWPDGNPKKTIVTGIEVNGEARTLWAPKPSAMLTAIKEALTTAAGVQPMLVGGTGFVEFTGYGKAEAGKNPQKLYKAGYTPPNAFAEAASNTAPANTEDEAARKAALAATLSPEDRLLLGIPA